MVIAGKAATGQAGIKPGMMRACAVALRCADEWVTRPFDRTNKHVAFVFNPGTEEESSILAHVIVTHSEADTMLFGHECHKTSWPGAKSLQRYFDLEIRGSLQPVLLASLELILVKARRQFT